MNLNMRAVDIGCIILLVAAVVAGGFFFQHNFSRHSFQVKFEAEQLLDQKNSLKFAVAKLGQLESQFKEQANRVLELNKRIPKAPRMGDFLSQLHARVEQRNITLIDFNHKPAQRVEQYRRIPVQIIVKGGFLNIYGLIHDLETLNRVFIFEKIMIKRQEEKKICQATLLGSVFQQ
jgi:Tfp pilus assembly protein PilO